MLIDDGFLDAIAPYDLNKVEQDDALILGIDEHYTIRLLNPAWQRAAEDFGHPEVARTWTLGKSLLEAIREPERSGCQRQLGEAVRRAEPLRDEYDCNDEQHRRRFGLVGYPLAEGRGLLMVHSIRHVSKRGEAAQEYVRRRFQTPAGLWLRCAGCQRFKDPNRDELWEYSSAESLAPEQVSHVMCYTCRCFFVG